MEYFSHESGNTMKYNPITGETRSVAEFNQARSEIPPEGSSASKFEKVGESVEKPTSE